MTITMFELLILACIFTIGFVAGYGAREWKSRRRRKQYRPIDEYADHSRFSQSKTENTH